MNKMVTIVEVGYNKYSVVGKKFSITFTGKETALAFCKQKGLIVKN